MVDYSIGERYVNGAFDLWQEMYSNRFVLRSHNHETDNETFNKRLSVLLQSMEIEPGLDYVRNPWEIRFADEELYGIFLLKL